MKRWIVVISMAVVLPVLLAATKTSTVMVGTNGVVVKPVGFWDSNSVDVARTSGNPWATNGLGYITYGGAKIAFDGAVEAPWYVGPGGLPPDFSALTVGGGVASITDMGAATFAGGLMQVDDYGNTTVSGVLALSGVGSTVTNSDSCIFWNSNNQALYIRGTNGVDKLITSWP